MFFMKTIMSDVLNVPSRFFETVNSSAPIAWRETRDIKSLYSDEMFKASFVRDSSNCCEAFSAFSKSFRKKETLKYDLGDQKV